MKTNILVFYGSYRQDRKGIRLAQYVTEQFRLSGVQAELVDAKATGLPMLDKMYKEYPKNEVPAAMDRLARKIKAADGFVFVAGEYNKGVQPGLKNLVDHFLEEWFWRPAAIVSYSSNKFGGVRAGVSWQSILSELGMVVISSALAVGPITESLDENSKPVGDGGSQLEKYFPRFAKDLLWWAEAAKSQHSRRSPPY